MLLAFSVIGVTPVSGSAPQDELDWKAKSIDGREISLAQPDRLTVIFFVGVECPVARHYAARLQSLSQLFAEQPVSFIGVDSNLQDAASEVEKLVQELKLSYPLVHDADQRIAKLLDAKRTGEVVVVGCGEPKSLSGQGGQIRYRGRIDDQVSPGIRRSAPTTNELREVIEQWLATKTFSVPNTEPVGCLLTYSKTSEGSADPSQASVTFCKDVAPILFQHCIECHRPGEIGPFDVSNYHETRGWAEMMVETIEQGRMPPWHANPNHGSFKNARHVSTEIAKPIRAWIEAGTPYGDEAQLPKIPERIEGWRLPKEPDLVVEMSDIPYKIPANGTVDYQYFVVDPKLQEDKWVSSAQVIPGSAAVVHHAIVFIRPPDGVDFRGIGWLTAYVPGQRAMEFPSGFARRIPAGSKFVFQMHYTPNGVETIDRSKIGMNFLDASEVTDEVFTLVGIDQEFEIPPGEANHRVDGKVPYLPKDGTLLAVMPHMHLRGKSFELRAKSIDGEAQPANLLLDVPRYDFNWQHTYELQTPLAFQNIDQLEFTAVFDNSTGNPFNPNPKEYVMWGDQTWEEMAVCFFEVSKPYKRDSNALADAASPKRIASDNSSAPQASEDDATKKLALKLLAKFDTNRDQCISQDEATRVFQDYAFRRFDRDSDGKLTIDELTLTFRDQRVQ
jgi:peroxiredoxin